MALDRFSTLTDRLQKISFWPANAFLFFIFFFTPSGYSQSILDRFELIEINGKVQVNWVIRSGNTCNGVEIHRSSDSLNFEKIGQIGGVCGDLTKPVAYQFIDENPILDQISYYKLALGGFGFSNTLSILLIDTKSTGFQIRPHPTTGPVALYFEKSINDFYQLQIFQVDGKRLAEYNTADAVFHLDIGHLTPGIYPFTIRSTSGNHRMSGKFILL